MANRIDQCLFYTQCSVLSTVEWDRDIETLHARCSIQSKYLSQKVVIQTENQKRQRLVTQDPALSNGWRLNGVRYDEGALLCPLTLFLTCQIQRNDLEKEKKND